MTLSVSLPDELARRLAAEAGRRGQSVEELSAELLATALPAEDDDALEAFIGSGESGEAAWAGRDTAELRAEARRRAG